MKMNKITWFTIFSIIAVTVGLGLISGITFAFMQNKVDVSESVTDVSLTSCAKIRFTGESSINLTNTYPMSRNKALNNTPYTFEVTSNCTGNENTGFGLYLATLSSNTLTDEKIRYILRENGTNNILEEGLLNTVVDAKADFADYMLQEYATGMSTQKSNINKIYKLFSYDSAVNGTLKYDLFLYVDESVTENASVSEEFVAGVAVKANPSAA